MLAVWFVKRCCCACVRAPAGVLWGLGTAIMQCCRSIRRTCAGAAALGQRRPPSAPTDSATSFATRSPPPPPPPPPPPSSSKLSVMMYALLQCVKLCIGQQLGFVQALQPHAESWQSQRDYLLLTHLQSLLPQLGLVRCLAELIRLHLGLCFLLLESGLPFLPLPPRLVALASDKNGHLRQRVRLAPAPLPPPSIIQLCPLGGMWRFTVTPNRVAAQPRSRFDTRPDAPPRRASVTRPPAAVATRPPFPPTVCLLNPLPSSCASPLIRSSQLPAHNPPRSPTPPTPASPATSGTATRRTQHHGRRRTQHEAIGQCRTARRPSVSATSPQDRDNVN